MVEVASSLGIVLGAIVLLRVALSSLGLGSVPGSQPALRVRSSCALGPRKRLHVIEAHGEHLLVGVSEQGVTLLRELPPDPHAEADESPSPVRERRVAWLRRLLPGVGAGLVALVVVSLSAPAFAQSATEPLATLAPESGSDAPLLTLALDGATAPEGIASSLEALALLTIVAIAPSILLMATCFTRIVIVLALLRQALGVQHLPPNQVLVGLSLFTTFFVMAPVIERVRVEAVEPYTQQQIGGPEALERAVLPMRAYMLDFTHERDLDLFLELAEAEVPTDPMAVPLPTLLPAFVLSELRTAFEIGFMIYLPFLVIDLVIASMLISMGMIVLPPIVISLPFKLMLFVLLDGWHLVIGSLVQGLRG